MNLKIKEICKEKGVTITSLAEKLNIKQESLSRAINGNPTVETLQKISSALGVSISELFEANKGFTALIDNNGTLYRVNSIEELKRLIAEIEK